MKVTGAQYLDKNPDVKQAGLDPLFHFLTFVCPDGPLKEGRVIDMPELPPGWDWQVYVNGWPDLTGMNQEQAEAHYLEYGYKEGNGQYGRWPVPGQGWSPPTTPGMHDITSLPGAFGMSVAKDANKVSIGLYKKDGVARFYEYDGTLKEIPELAKQIESHYMITIRPDGLRLITTEVPAQVIKEQHDKSWKVTRLLPQPESCAFEQLDRNGELVIMAVDKAWGNNITLFKGDINGNNFQPWKIITGRYLNYGISNNGIRLCGSTGPTKDDTPIIANENGGDIRGRSDYADQQYAYTVGKDGMWALGAQSITEADGFRRAYIDLFDGTNLRTAYNFKPPYDPPWTMDLQAHPITGDWWCVASVWSETGRCQPVLVRSKDNGNTWQYVISVPMKACIAMCFADDGIYLIGGEFGNYMKLCFYKF